LFHVPALALWAFGRPGPVLGQRLDSIKDILAVTAAILICRHTFLLQDSSQHGMRPASAAGTQINLEQCESGVHRPGSLPNKPMQLAARLKSKERYLVCKRAGRRS
jgi:hypothetical protein